MTTTPTDPATPAPGAPAAAAAPAAPASPAPAAVPEWATALDGDLRSLVQVKGWKEPADAMRAYAELEPKITAKGVILPGEKATEADWNAFYTALGRPEAADKYEIKAPAGTDGKPKEFSEHDTRFHEHMRPLVHKAGLTQAQLDILAEGFNGFSAAMLEGQEAAVTEGLKNSEVTMKKEWGLAYDAKLSMAKNGLRQFGGDELVGLLEQSGLGNHPAMLRAFAAIGEAIGEDAGVAGAGGGGAAGALDPASAKREIEKLKGDMKAQGDKHPFYDPSHPERKTFLDRWGELHRMAAG